MIAYKHEWLDHLHFREEALVAMNDNYITKEECAAIYKKYPVDFYTPNIFIRIGLFVLTIIILLFSFGLFALISSNDIIAKLGTLSIVFGFFCFVALELMINTKKHYRSGVDDGLLWGGTIALLCGICLPNNFTELTISIILFVISLLCSLRYADKLMTAITYLSLLSILFYCCVEMGHIAKAIVPFFIMVTSLFAYFISIKIKNKNIVFYYKDCIQIIEIVSLISLYTAGNYFIVRELSNEMFHLNLQPGESIPFGWLFWIFSCIIPVIYVARGIQKKDVIMLRVGLLLFTAMVFTIRYYHTILPIESMMTIAGVILLAISYTLMKWLNKPVYGFTSLEISSANTMDKMQIESLILMQTFKPGADTDLTKFGGGNFGGGGASGDF
ncbi:hypothetical protein LK994_14465 [Ferruginibacter lapsinanis]|uniref:hypothetical protein n=1 Tax=Ferruginibacter lapsinanis TaxID=563172 RepID=UPI001E3D15B6|nr:hypothetical protein [Ferruginibacter lapsinanis]UEG49841.1 hypothetical protein LK994_14465 [Ferruginibacter lapsinanis]